jgi:hypothetical protein
LLYLNSNVLIGKNIINYVPPVQHHNYIKYLAFQSPGCHRKLNPSRCLSAQGTLGQSSDFAGEQQLTRHQKTSAAMAKSHRRRRAARSMGKHSVKDLSSSNRDPPLAMLVSNLSSRSLFIYLFWDLIQIKIVTIQVKKSCQHCLFVGDSIISFLLVESNKITVHLFWEHTEKHIILNTVRDQV